MTRARPRHARRAPLRQRLVPWAVAAAVAGTVGLGAWISPDDEERPTAAPVPDRVLGTVTRPVDDLQQLSRSLANERPVPAAPSRPERGRGDEAAVELDAVGQRYLTEDLNFWSGPGESYELMDVIPTGRQVAVTGQETDGWVQILLGERSGWVNAAYLSEEKPVEPAPVEDAETGSPDDADTDTSEVSGISSAPCASGSTVESGLTPDAIRVHRAVCAEFPEVTSYGGLRSDGEHGEGRALDIMISGSTGDAIAEYVRANHAALGVSEVLWAQRIWTVQRSSEGWRWFEDRGSATANHYDHVHVTVYGDSGG